MEPLIQMNKFELIDMPGMTTIAFVVEKNEEDLIGNKPLLTLQKIECIDTEVDGRIKKTFNVIKLNDLMANSSSFVYCISLNGMFFSNDSFDF